ncbi:MAG: hypothetical protein WEC84_03590 [Candidatus Andersenbacteria bacterium]
MIKGQLIDNAPYVTIPLAWGQAVQDIVAKIDTAFDGDVKVSSARATQLNIPISHIENIRLADGQLVTMPSAIAYVELKGLVDSVEVLLASGDPIIGNGFMKKFDIVLTIDYPHQVVELE